MDSRNIWLTSIYYKDLLPFHLPLLEVPMIKIYPILEDTYYIVMDVKSIQRVTKKIINEKVDLGT